MILGSALDTRRAHVLEAARAAQAKARSECLRAMRAGRGARLAQRASEASRLERQARRGSRQSSEVAERRLARLRPRELEVMLLLAAGLHTDEVAHALFISEHTVRTHVKQALRHGNAHSRQEVFRLLTSARESNTVQLAGRRVQPFLDQWWSLAQNRPD